MLIPASASASNMSAATPGRCFMPAPTSETLRDVAVAGEAARARPRRRSARGSAPRGAGRSCGSVNEMSVWPGGGDVLDDHVDVHARVGERAEDAARDAGPVGHAEDRRLRLRGVVRDARDDRLLEHVLLLHDPGAVGSSSNDERTWTATPWFRAYSTERSIRTLAPEAASSSISSYVTASSLRASGTMRGSAVKTPVDVGVDLADVGVERRGERDRGRVGAAAAERRDVELGRDALEAGDDRRSCPASSASRTRSRRISTIAPGRGSCP